MSKLYRKSISLFIDWLDRLNANKYLNIVLMAVIIISILIFFFSTYPDSMNRIQILLIPAVAGLDIYLLGAKNHVVRETANFVAGILFVGFIFFGLALVTMGLVILKSL